jgi:hypothetical protein
MNDGVFVYPEPGVTIKFAAPPAKIGPETLIAVVGPSGKLPVPAARKHRRQTRTLPRHQQSGRPESA